eukprot:s77_g34.t1
MCWEMLGAGSVMNLPLGIQLYPVIWCFDLFGAALEGNFLFVSAFIRRSSSCAAKVFNANACGAHSRFCSVSVCHSSGWLLAACKSGT